MSSCKIKVTRSYGDEDFEEVFLKLLKRKMMSFLRDMEEEKVMNYNKDRCTTPIIQSNEVKDD